jgi:hypothetical protein
MAGFRKQFPIRNVELPARLPEAPRLSLDDFSGRVVTGISPDEIARYNREVERFLEAYPRFLKDLNTYREIKSRAFSFDVWLLNSGSCPAEEIGIHLHFPDGFDVFDAGHGPREPHKPAFPRQPQTFAERFQEMNFLTNLGSMSRMPSIPSATPKANSPQIRKTNSYDVDHEWPSLKHGYQARVISLEIVFTSFDMIKSFNVPYQISAANHPDTQKGELHFIVPNTTEVAGK